MFERKTIVDQIEITRSGVIQIRFGLLLIEDGTEINCEWHRTAIEPGGDVDAQIAAVNNHLQALRKRVGRVVSHPPLELSGIKLLKDVIAVIHTPELVQKFRADVSRQLMAAQL